MSGLKRRRSFDGAAPRELGLRTTGACPVTPPNRHQQPTIASSNPMIWCPAAPRRLTTKPDHNKIRHEPIPADSAKAQAQVSDGIRQTARILQAGGRGFKSPSSAREK